MTMADREHRVTLTANVDQYVAAMERARAATRGVGRAYWGLVSIVGLGGIAIGSALTLLLTMV